MNSFQCEVFIKKIHYRPPYYMFNHWPISIPYNSMNADIFLPLTFKERSITDGVSYSCKRGS